MNNYLNPFINFSLEELIDAYAIFSYDQDAEGLAWVCDAFCSQVTLELELLN